MKYCSLPQNRALRRISPFHGVNCAVSRHKQGFAPLFWFKWEMTQSRLLCYVSDFKEFSAQHEGYLFLRQSNLWDPTGENSSYSDTPTQPAPKGFLLPQTDYLLMSCFWPLTVYGELSFQERTIYFPWHSWPLGVTSSTNRQGQWLQTFAGTTIAKQNYSSLEISADKVLANLR